MQNYVEAFIATTDEGEKLIHTVVIVFDEEGIGSVDRVYTFENVNVLRDNNHLFHDIHHVKIPGMEIEETDCLTMVECIEAGLDMEELNG